MPISGRCTILSFALVLAGCHALQPVESLPEPLTGLVQPACGPADGPALDFSLQTEDGETTLSIYLWQGLPAEPIQWPPRRSGIDSFHGDLCQSGSCQSVERLGITLDPGQPGVVVGTLTVQGEHGTRLRAEYRAAWLEQPGLICG